MAEGPFDKFLSPYALMPRSENVEDLRGTPWPWHPAGAARKEPQQTLTSDAVVDDILTRIRGSDIPPITNRLQQQAGAGDVSPITDSELMKFMLDIEAMNPYEPRKTAKGK